MSHKRNVEIFHKQKRDEKLHGARSEKELKQQLDEIEKAAKQAIVNDRLESSGMFCNASLGNLTTPPGPPAFLQEVSDFHKLRSQCKILSETSVNSIEENLRENRYKSLFPFIKFFDFRHLFR